MEYIVSKHRPFVATCSWNKIQSTLTNLMRMEAREISISHSPRSDGGLKVPGLETRKLVGDSMNHEITVQLGDKNGHTTMMLNPSQAVETIQQNSGAWVYADNQLIQADQVNEDNLSTVSQVRILPALVGGC
jgi:hypothetical protein